MASGNIISDISDHFSQFCILKSMRDKIKKNKSKVRDFSRFSRDSFNVDLSYVDWNALLDKKSSSSCKLIFIQLFTPNRLLVL